MNSVDKVKALCKERKIPISRLEKDLQFGNGYIGQLKKGTFPDDRLVLIANYLNVTTAFLTGEEQKENPAAESSEVSEKNIRLINWFRSLPAEKQRAILSSQDAPAEVLSDVDH